MRRFVAPALALAFGVFSVTAATTAAEDVTWEAGYPQRAANGCVEYVAAWSDGTYTTTPLTCPDGALAGEDRTIVEIIEHTAANGCTEYVTRWSDGSFSWVPFSCPPGETYDKPYPRQLAPASVTDAAPVPPSPAPPLLATFNPYPFTQYGDRYDCADFENQAMTQAVLRADPSDPNNLDPDGDGIACADNPAPTDSDAVTRPTE